jgi:hypothetical protein
MIDNVTSVGAGAPHTPKPPARTQAPAQPGPAASAETAELALDAPPPEVLNALDAAQRVLSDLRAHKVDLRYVVDAESKKVHAELVGPDGSVLREIPARHALDLLTSEHVVDALA